MLSTSTMGEFTRLSLLFNSSERFKFLSPGEELGVDEVGLIEDLGVSWSSASGDLFWLSSFKSTSSGVFGVFGSSDILEKNKRVSFSKLLFTIFYLKINFIFHYSK